MMKMKTFKPLFVLMLALVMMAPSAFAQRGQVDPEARAERMKAQVDEIVKKLELDEEKSESVRAILGEQSEKQSELFASYAGQGREAMQLMREEMQELQKSTNEKLKNVLSEEQMKTYKKLREEMSPRRGQRGGRRGQASIN